MKGLRKIAANRALWMILLAVVVASVSGLAQTSGQIVVTNSSCAQLQITRVRLIAGGNAFHTFTVGRTISIGQMTINFTHTRRPDTVRLEFTHGGQSGQTDIPAPGQVSFACGTIRVTVAGTGPPPPYFSITTNKQQYVPGETITFTIYSPSQCSSASIRSTRPDGTIAVQNLGNLAAGQTRMVQGRAGDVTGTRTAKLYCGTTPVADTTFTIGQPTPPACTVRTPNTPSGPDSGIIGQSLSFTTGGAACSQGHAVHYRFDWGDGNRSSWGSATRSHSWDAMGQYEVMAQAHCTSTSTLSNWSSTTTVTIIELGTGPTTADSNSAELTRWSIPTSGALPQGIGINADGKVYFTEYNANKIGELDPTTNQIRERSVSGGPYGLYVSPRGGLHYTLVEANAVETMVFHGGTSRADLPTPAASPGTLVAAPTGPGEVNLWLPERNAGKVARFAPAQIWLHTIYIPTDPTMVLPTTLQVSGRATEVTPELHDMSVTEDGAGWLIPAAIISPSEETPPFTEWNTSYLWDVQLHRVAVAPDGHIWYTCGRGWIPQLNPSDGQQLLYGLPSGTQPLAVTVGPDGMVWFTDTRRPAIGVLDPSTWKVHLWPIPGGSEPFDLVRDSEGNIWFTDRAADAIGCLNPFRNEFVIYPLGGEVGPAFLVLDEDDAVWFTAERGNYVGRLSPLVPRPSSVGPGTFRATSVHTRLTGPTPWRVTTGWLL